jgi:hypothetical protein
MTGLLVGGFEAHVGTTHVFARTGGSVLTKVNGLEDAFPAVRQALVTLIVGGRDTYLDVGTSPVVCSLWTDLYLCASTRPVDTWQGTYRATQMILSNLRRRNWGPPGKALSQVHPARTIPRITDIKEDVGELLEPLVPLARALDVPSTTMAGGRLVPLAGLLADRTKWDQLCVDSSSLTKEVTRAGHSDMWMRPDFDVKGNIAELIPRDIACYFLSYGIDCAAEVADFASEGEEEYKTMARKLKEHIATHRTPVMASTASHAYVIAAFVEKDDGPWILIMDPNLGPDLSGRDMFPESHGVGWTPVVKFFAALCWMLLFTRPHDAAS